MRCVPAVRWVAVGLIVGSLGASQAARAQSPSAPRVANEEVWRPLLEWEGVRFKYLFYPRADNVNNGVVLLLINTNDVEVAYSFQVVFRSEAGEHVESVRGSLRAGEAKTGGHDGLFWIPFLDGTEITEVGLRRYRITPAAAAEAEAGAGT